MKTIYVTPAKGVLVRNPDANYQHLPEQGELVQSSPYWKRLEREGAVTVGAPPSSTLHRPRTRAAQSADKE